MKRGKSLVVGGTGGIGSAIVRQLIEQNYQTFFTYNQSQETANILEEESNGLAVKVQLNLLDWKNIEDFDYSMFFEVENIIFAAGIDNVSQFFDCSYEDLLEQFTINVFSPLLIIQKLINHLQLKNIIFISSIAGLHFEKDSGAYGLSKSSVFALSKMLNALELNKEININCIAPGWCQTNMTERVLSKKQLKLQEILDNKIDHEIIMPEDIATVCLFLISEKGKYISNQIIKIDTHDI